MLNEIINTSKTLTFKCVNPMKMYSKKYKLTKRSFLLFLFANKFQKHKKKDETNSSTREISCEAEPKRDIMLCFGFRREPKIKPEP